MLGLALQQRQRTNAVNRRSQAPIYVALLHHPVYDKNHQVVTTAVTNMDIHDIARSGQTYGVRGFYLVTPVKPLQKLALKIIDHWELGYGSQYNVTRKDALGAGADQRQPRRHDYRHRKRDRSKNPPWS